MFQLTRLCGFGLSVSVTCVEFRAPPSDMAGVSARFRRRGPGYEPERTGRHSYTVEIGYRKSE